MTKDMYTFWGLWVGSVVLISTINVVLFSDTYLTMKFFTMLMFMSLIGAGLAIEPLELHLHETIIFLVFFISIPVVSIIYYYDYQLPENFLKEIFSISFFSAMLIAIIYSKISTKITLTAKEEKSLKSTVSELNPFIDEDSEYQPKKVLSTENKISYHRNYPFEPNQSVNSVIEPNPFIDEDSEYEPKKVLSTENKISYYRNYPVEPNQSVNSVIEPNPFIDEDSEYQPKKVLRNENKILYHSQYHPYNRGKNDSFNNFSRKILDLKNGKSGTVKYFFELLKGGFDSNIDVIVIVPSHDPLNSHSPVRRLAQELASYNHWYDGTGIVRRTKKIKKLSQGGSRDKNIHLNSLEISKPSLIKNKNVLVFDDVTTSGNSLYATMQLLNNSGVNSVSGYAIGNTE